MCPRYRTGRCSHLDALGHGLGAALPSNLARPTWGSIGNRPNAWGKSTQRQGRGVGQVEQAALGRSFHAPERLALKRRRELPRLQEALLAPDGLEPTQAT